MLCKVRGADTGHKTQLSSHALLCVSATVPGPAADGWWSAVRHIGCVFGLKPNEDAFDSFGLPYPDLAVTISTIRMEPAANMWEHFNTPGVPFFCASQTHKR